MLIDRKQVSWLVATLVLSAAAMVAFGWESRRREPSGGNPVGLTLGIVAFALKGVFASLNQPLHIGGRPGPSSWSTARRGVQCGGRHVLGLGRLAQQPVEQQPT